MMEQLEQTSQVATATSPLVSVVLPTHNGAAYVRESIESVLGQTLADLELIIVDDASTDQTPDILAWYAARDRRIQFVRHRVNRKLPAALNTGFSLARGQYFTWTSDDNCYRAHALERMVAFLESHQAVDIVYADYTDIDEHGRRGAKVVVEEPPALAYKNPVRACFVYRRKVQERLGGYAEDLFCAEDYDFWLRASVKFDLATLHEDLYLYRRHAKSLTESARERVDAAVRRTLARNLPRLRWMSHRSRSAAYLRVARKAESAWAARMYLAKALWHSPANVLRNAPRWWLAQAALGERIAAAMNRLKGAGR